MLTHHSLAEFINRTFPIDPKVYDSLLEKCHTLEFKKGEYLLYKGQICDTVYFIVEGLARSFYKTLDNEKEVTSWFIPEGEFACSINSFVHESPTFEFIQLEEDTIVIAIHKKDLNTICLQFSIVCMLTRHVTEKYLCLFDERIRSFQLTPWERYNRFLLQYPTLKARVKLSHLSSYLGIGRSTLCRLRNNK
ncbi:MAG: Crp/Fnr family transcriptional regulator [Spirosomataceae bacterium]